MSLSFPCFCLVLCTERWPIISPSLRLPLLTSLNFFHMTLSPMSLLSYAWLAWNLSSLPWPPPCSEKHIKIIQIWHGKMGSWLVKYLKRWYSNARVGNFVELFPFSVVLQKVFSIICSCYLNLERKDIFLLDYGGLPFMGCQISTQFLSHSVPSTGQWEAGNKMKNVLGWVKGREITYQLLSGAKQTWEKLIEYIAN